MRVALDERDGCEDGRREKLYKMLSRFAVHPSMESHLLLRPHREGDAESGPFVEPDYLEGLLCEFARVAGEAGDVLDRFLPEVWAGALAPREEFGKVRQVVENVDWRGVRIDGRGRGKGSPAAFPVPRGTILPVGDREALLWNHGDARGVTARSYFQGSRSTPRPLRLVRHSGHGSWDDTAQAVLGLSKMNWNNDALYDQLPVTMSYAKVLSRVVKRIPQLRRTPYQFRLFM